VIASLVLRQPNPTVKAEARNRTVGYTQVIELDSMTGVRGFPRAKALRFAKPYVNGLVTLFPRACMGIAPKILGDDTRVIGEPWNAEPFAEADLLVLDTAPSRTN
jgi:hypothetical protein